MKTHVLVTFHAAENLPGVPLQVKLPFCLLGLGCMTIADPITGARGIKCHSGLGQKPVPTLHVSLWPRGLG